jgi:hypothetical protein
MVSETPTKLNVNLTKMEAAAILQYVVWQNLEASKFLLGELPKKITVTIAGRTDTQKTAVVELAVELRNPAALLDPIAKSLYEAQVRAIFHRIFEPIFKEAPVMMLSLPN